MTIAVGFLCTDGILVAADTSIILSDGTKTDGPKVGAVQGPTGTYVIANSAEDGNAANALAVNILRHLEANSYGSISEVEFLISDLMTQWWQDFRQSEPKPLQFILGSVLRGVPRLHFCEPPNTVYQKMEYVAVGTGAKTTDPLVKMFFPDYDIAARDRLWQMAYLFYRAKKEAAFCGGRTTPIYLDLDGSAPHHVPFPEMDEAEKLGPEIDLHLRDMLMKYISWRMNEFNFSPLHDD